MRQQRKVEVETRLETQPETHAPGSPGRRTRTALRLIETVQARGKPGATAQDLALALADLATERGIQKRLRALARAGKLRRTWEYFEHVSGGLAGRWRDFTP